MKAGDVLLFHRYGGWRTDFLGTLMAKVIQWTTRSHWNHAALAVSSDAYVEATSGGVVISEIYEPLPFSDVQVVPVAYDDDDDRNQAVAWALARAGVRYGYWNAFMCGVNNVLVGLHLAIKSTDTIICSELVAEAMERAGFDFGTDSANVSPGDLAEALGMGR